VVSLVAKQVVNWGKAKGNVRLLELNAMHILEAKTIYSKILSGLHDTSISTGNSNPNDDRQRLLRDIDARGRKLLLVVDEVDQLHTRDEEVLYDLFELSARPKSRLALLSIANSLNMTERFLPRLKEMNALPEEVNFEPYKSSDIMNIIKSRLPEPHINAFDEHAITMCAAKVASSGSGDIRKALDICRAAVGHAMEHGSNVVAVKHMAATIGKLMGSKQVATCMALPQSQQVMVCALMHVFGGRVQSPLLLTKVHEGYRSFCKLHTNTMTSLSKGELVDVLHVLESQGLLELSGSVKKQVKMNISEAEVRRALEKIGDGSFFRNLLDTKLP